VTNLGINDLEIGSFVKFAMTLDINPKQRRYLRSLAHALNSTVAIGQSGATAAVCDEIDAALAHHELIKVKLPSLDKAQRRTLLDTAAAHCSACVVQVIGRIGVLYRPAEPPKISIPSD
jgi:RNA-binding protein